MRWEWALCDGLALGFLIYEWVSIRRTLRRDRAARAEAERKAKGFAPGPQQGSALHSPGDERPLDPASI
jgi:hypothetical protein